MHKTRSGELMIFGESLLWSLFPIFTILTVSGLPPLYSASITTFVAALFFAAVISLQKNWKQLLYVQAWKYILGATLIIGILFYSLVFVGISKTSAGNAGIALLMEVFFSFLILYFWKKERATARNVMGAVKWPLAQYWFFCLRLQAQELEI
jgi:drug/metabolite transporter (DMT)-like permease